jgi:hypothetical protein
MQPTLWESVDSRYVVNDGCFHFRRDYHSTGNCAPGNPSLPKNGVLSNLPGATSRTALSWREIAESLTEDDPYR